jgi:tripartite ATP-independent transporter DctM subunit
MGDLTAMAEPRATPLPWWWRGLHAVEDAVVVLVLLAMMLVGGADLEIWRRLGVALRVPGAEDLIRHLTLIVGMLGGMLAAREGRLLSMGSLPQFLPARWRRAFALASGVVAVGVSGYLAAAAWKFVGIEREAGHRLAGGVPIWWTQLALPAGFAVIALRVLWGSAQTWRGRLLVAGLSVAVALITAKPLVAPTAMQWPCLILLGVATLMGAPIFVTLGGAALLLFWSRGEPIASIALDHYDQVTNPLLATVPLFTLAGYLLAESKASERLVRFFGAWTGFIRGGPAIVTALACAFFTTFTGGSGVTILALGGLLMPVLLAARYDERTALGFMTGAGSLGILLPPCLPLIIYSIIGKVSMNAMFLGGVLPGLLMVALTGAWGVWSGPQLSREERRFDLREALRASWSAKWELALPVIPLVLIFGGYALPVPAAAFTAFYAFVVETFVHRELKWRSSLPRTFTECGLLIGGVLLILGAAMGFTNFLITQHVPDNAAAWIGKAITSKVVFLLVLNLFLIVVGCLMDIFSAIVVVVPLLLPMAAVFDIDPVHLGIIFLANLELGYLTPPVGMNLFLASYRFNKPVMEVTRATLPMLVVLLVGVLLITYVPWLTTVLPRLLAK